jgi:hypothetical protein
MRELFAILCLAIFIPIVIALWNLNTVRNYENSMIKNIKEKGYHDLCWHHNVKVKITPEEVNEDD